MKRFLAIVFAAVLLLSIWGCNQNSGDPVNNEVFTDEFFQDVVQIRVSFIDDPITGEQLAAVVRYLKSLHLTHSEEDLPEEKEPGLYGGRAIERMEFTKSDGTMLETRISQWAMSGLPGGSYCVSDAEEAVERGDKNILRSIWEASGKDPDAYPRFL